MTGSTNLNITHIAQSQAQKYVTANEAFDDLDAAMTETVSLSFSTGNVTVTSTQYTRNLVFVCTNVSTDRVLNVPQSKKEIIVDNSAGTAPVVVARGGGTVTVPAGEIKRTYTDGTTAGITDVGGGGAGGSGSIYDFGFWQFDSPSASQTIGKVDIARDVTIPADMTGAVGSVGTAPGATYAIKVTDDGSSIGTISISTAGAFTFTTVGNTAKSVASGSVVRFISPASTDGTIEDLSATIKVTVD